MSHVMFSTRTVIVKEHGSFNESDNWSNEPILIPPIPPSDLPHCKIIKIEYKFQVDSAKCYFQEMIGK